MSAAKHPLYGGLVSIVFALAGGCGGAAATEAPPAAVAQPEVSAPESDATPEEPNVEVVTEPEEPATPAAEATPDAVAVDETEAESTEEIPAVEPKVVAETGAESEASEQSEAVTEAPDPNQLYWDSMGQLNSELEYDGALETAEKIAASDQSGFAKLNIAVLMDRKGDPETALKALDELIEAKTPAALAALDAKLSVLTRQGRGNELEPFLRENWKATSESIPYAVVLGRLLLDRGDLDEVFQLGLEILRLQEKSAPALALIGRYYIR